MIQSTKVILSEEEKQLISNSGWIMIKLSITNKVIGLLNYLLVDYKNIVSTNKQYLIPGLYISSPKISKGENYLSLPYVILDYPKIFNKNAVFAIRTMFWWGNFFSCTLHISGHYKNILEEKLLYNITANKDAGLYICINENEWKHHFGIDNYRAITTLSNGEIAKLLKKPFIKVAYKINLQDWDIMHESLAEKFTKLMKLFY
ncbi:MAG: hypothetical protein IPJ81_05620 [Chitinophagaceae bacterium]|nr:hypothetical protein [Chitinophagaceae bacterium]